MEEPKKVYDLENRLIEFSVLIVKITETIYKNKAGNHIAGQLVRSGTAPALYYGEAQGAESRTDFVHKIKIIIKELRETRIALLIVSKIPLTDKLDLLNRAMQECNELISIFIKSAETARKNLALEKKIFI